MSPELRTNKGRVKTVALDGDSAFNMERAEEMASRLQRLINDRRYTNVRLVLCEKFPPEYALQFTVAILEGRAGSIKYKTHDNGDIQINEISINQDEKRKTK